METPVNVNGLPGLHRVRRGLSDGSTRTYLYAWRGGPQIGIEGETLDVETRYAAAVEKFKPRDKKKRQRARTATRNEKALLSLVLRKLVQNARQRAAKRHVNFTIDLSVVLSLLERQRWTCAVSGLPFDTAYSVGDATYNPYGISIDRIDAKGGYTRNNIRLVLTAVNFAMNDWGEETYLRIAKAAVARDMLQSVAA